jgi:hypothetical protein
MAFGGVATGNINANDGAIVAGKARYNGLMPPMFSANVRQIGTNIVAVAEFDDTSVTNVIIVVNTIKIANGDVPLNHLCNVQPIKRDKPDA